MPPLEDIDGLTPAKLKDLVLKLLEKVAALERTVAAQRDEIARLKGGPGRPNIKPNSKPSGMEQATDPKPAGGSGQERRRRGSTRSKLSIDNFERVLPRRCRSWPEPPAGFGSVACSMPLGWIFGLMFGRPGPPLSRAISSRWAATVLSSAATFSKSFRTKSFSLAGVRPSISSGGGMPTQNPTRAALRIL